MNTNLFKTSILQCFYSSCFVSMLFCGLLFVQLYRLLVILAHLGFMAQKSGFCHPWAGRAVAAKLTNKPNTWGLTLTDWFKCRAPRPPKKRSNVDSRSSAQLNGR